jgi:hypothetical protein
MLNKIRYSLITIFISIAVIACSKTTSDVTVEQGMSQQEVIDMLGAPTITQSYTLDALTVTHSEWEDKSGTLSIQFQNDQAQSSFFTTSQN